MLLTPFFMTLIAGLSTIIGYFFIYIKTKDINKFIVICLSFSVGVILSLSVLDLLPSSIRVIYKSSSNLLLTTIYLNLFFMIGYFLIIALKKIESPIKNDLYRVGIISFIILFLLLLIMSTIYFNTNIIFQIVIQSVKVVAEQFI